jgi:hypothetical protein
LVPLTTEKSLENLKQTINYFANQSTSISAVLIYFAKLRAHKDSLPNTVLVVLRSNAQM